MDDHAQRQLQALVDLFAHYHLEELIVENGTLKVHLRRAPARPRSPAPAPVPLQRPPDAPPKSGRTVAVRSPLTGIFYRAASPDSPPFVELGDLVEEGQTVGIVEAMKVFNEIKAEWRGRVVAIPAQNGQLVHPGEPLVVLEFITDEEQP